MMENGNSSEDAQAICESIKKRETAGYTPSVGVSNYPLEG